MAGAKSGVATQSESLNGKCLFTHCYGYALNLAVDDVIQSLKEMFSAAYEISKLVKNHHNETLDQIKVEFQTRNELQGIHTLCPTRCTVRGDALAAFVDN